MEYQEWKSRINSILENNTGLGCDCLVDVDYMSYFNDGYTPFEVAKIVVEQEWGHNTPELREDA